jgi:hypothetical protein
MKSEDLDQIRQLLREEITNHALDVANCRQRTREWIKEAWAPYLEALKSKDLPEDYAPTTQAGQVALLKLEAHERLAKARMIECFGHEVPADAVDSPEEIEKLAAERLWRNVHDRK